MLETIEHEIETSPSGQVRSKVTHGGQGCLWILLGKALYGNPKDFLPSNPPLSNRYFSLIQGGLDGGKVFVSVCVSGGDQILKGHSTSSQLCQ